ncbi:MAG: WXG100 family type VII secretion target [Mycobacterium sp.]|uniref:WXG100 family type VII secretion target n=1 Tax=Mycobacterium sp. TaxID=1785 RepID=UPI003F9882D7
MAEAFRVDPEALADAVWRMADFGRHTERMLGEIDSLVTDLHATWTGQGAAAHAEAHQRWVRGEAMMREALGRLRAAGAIAHRNYTSVRTTNVAMWS